MIPTSCEFIVDRQVTGRSRHGRHMHTLRKLAREIHRRSVWQVLAGYATVSAAVLFGLDRASVPLGLPLWTTDMAIALLLIGLPIVGATTLAHGAPPWLRIEDEIDPNDLVGLTPDEVHVIPRDHPLHSVRLLTWRNAILGGVMASALLVTSVVAYLAMWSLGIGPVGSLLAQGILEPGDRVLLMVAEVADGPDAAQGVIAFAEHMRLCDVLEVAEWASLGIDRPADLAAAVAGAAAANLGAVVVASLVRDGDGYRVSGSIHLPDGRRVAAFEEVTEDGDDLIEATELVSTRLRERFGESLRDIRAGRSSRST